MIKFDLPPLFQPRVEKNFDPPTSSLNPPPKEKFQPPTSFWTIRTLVYTLGAARALAPIITKPKRPCFHQLFPIFWFPSYFSDKSNSVQRGTVPSSVSGGGRAA